MIQIQRTLPGTLFFIRKNLIRPPSIRFGEHIDSRKHKKFGYGGGGGEGSMQNLVIRDEEVHVHVEVVLYHPVLL